MNKLIPLLLLCYIILVAFILIDVEANDSKAVIHRNKRYLAFMNKSRFFLKFNFKANIIPWNQLFAQAIGFRMTWDDSPDTFRYLHRRIKRRDVYDYVETLLDRNGFNGYHCVRRAICELEIIEEPEMIYHKLLKIVVRKNSSSTERWHNTTSEDCQTSLSTCPFSMLAVSTYTDIM